MKFYSVVLIAAATTLGLANVAHSAGDSQKLTIKGTRGKPAELTVEKMELKPAERGATHVHKDNPCAFYVLEGVVTEGRGTATRDYAAGESFKIEGKTEHWFQNNGNAPARYLSMCL